MSLLPRRPTLRDLLRLAVVLLAVGVYVAAAYGILAIVPREIATPVVLALILGPFGALVVLRTLWPQGVPRMRRKMPTEKDRDDH